MSVFQFDTTKRFKRVVRPIGGELLCVYLDGEPYIGDYRDLERHKGKRVTVETVIDGRAFVVLGRGERGRKWVPLMPYW